MAGIPKQDHVISLLASRTYSHRGLSISFSTLLVVTAISFIYSLLQINAANAKYAATLSLSESRKSLVFLSYSLALDTYDLVEEAFLHPTRRPALRDSCTEKAREFRDVRDKYAVLLSGVTGGSDSLRSASRVFFASVDSLIVKASLIFDMKSLPTKKTAFEKETESFFKSDRRAYFNQLSSRNALMTLESETSLTEALRAGNLTENASGQWIAISLFLLFFTLVLASIVIVREHQATSLVHRFKAVVDQYNNPIRITELSGQTLYVNAEYERWSGSPKDELIAADGFAGLTPVNGISGVPPSFRAVLESLSNGETWSGDVEIRHQNGSVSSSMMIAIPIVDRRGKVQEVISIFHDLMEQRKLVRTVEETRKQYQSLVESSLDGILVVQDNELVFVNPAAVRIFQYESSDDLKRVWFIDIVAPGSRPFLPPAYKHRSAGEEILKNYEMKGLTKNGKLIDLEINARVIIWNGRPALHASFRDISERKALEREQAVWLWEQETLSSIDRQLLGIVDLQKVLDIILHQVTLLTRCQFAGIAMVDVANQQVHWKAIKGGRSPLAGGLFKLTLGLSGVLVGKGQVVVEDCRPDGPFPIRDMPILEEEGIVSVGFFPLTVNSEPRGRLVVGFRQAHRFPEREVRVLISMAEKASIALTSGELYEDLLRREKELELLSGARVQAQEEERRRISREIHDDLGQLLTAIKFNLEILEDSISTGEDTAKRITDIKQLLDNVMKEAREISYNLMPSVLDDFGLGPGLLSLCEQFSKGTGIKVEFHEHGLKERLTPDMEIGLYRIVQEALNNVAKHADAKEVDVQIVRHETTLRLTVEDDGKGMVVLPPANPSERVGGTGLVGMRERASSFRGTLAIDSNPGKGTMINVEIPLGTK